MVRIIHHFAAVSLLALLIAKPTANADNAPNPTAAPKSPSLARLFSIRTGASGDRALLLVYRDDTRRVELFSVAEGGMKKLSSIVAPGQVWRATNYPTRKGTFFVVGYGSGKSFPGAPVQVILYGPELSHPQVIYRRETPRGQITDLRQVGTRIALTHFVTNEQTETGFLKPGRGAGEWNFDLAFQSRLAIALDYNGDTWIIGRPVPAPDVPRAELLLYDGAAWRDAPSYKGVKSVSFSSSGRLSHPSFFIGDGWERSPGTPQARLTRVDWDTDERRYLAKLIGETTQTHLTKIIPVSETLVVTVGTKSIDAYYFEVEKPDHVQIYAKPSTTPGVNLDAAYVGPIEKNAILAVYDGRLGVFKIPLQKRTHRGGTPEPEAEEEE